MSPVSIHLRILCCSLVRLLAKQGTNKSSFRLCRINRPSFLAAHHMRILGILLLFVALVCSSTAVAQRTRLITWGRPSYNKLGHSFDTEEAVPKPSPVLNGAKLLQGKTVTQTSVSPTGQHTVLLTSSGDVYAFGSNSYNQLGPVELSPDNTGARGLLWLNFSNTAMQDKRVKMVSAGKQHTLFLLEDNGFYCVGYDYRACSTSYMADSTRTPVSVDRLNFLHPNYTISSISTGDSHTLVLLENGNVVCFGSSQGACGQNGGYGSITDLTGEIPRANSSFYYVQVSAGDYFSLILDNKGKIWSVGSHVNLPLLTGLSQFLVSLMHASRTMTIFFSNTGDLYRCAQYGEVYPLPFKASNITLFSAGRELLLTQTRDGKVLGYGTNGLYGLDDYGATVYYSFGILGHYNVSTFDTPPIGIYDGKISALSGTNLTLLQAGDDFAVAVGTALPCPPGSFLDAENDTCIACIAGKFKNWTGDDPCVSCPAGSYSNEGSAKCVPCAPGFFAPNATAAFCMECPRGYYSDSYGSISCSSCPTGFEGSIGIVRASQAVGCIACGKGYFSSHDGQAICDRCLPGQYTDKEGLESCKECDPGSATSDFGSSHCPLCPLGQAQPLPGKSNCTACATGSFAGKLGSATCDPCPAGFYQNETAQFSCYLCPQNTFQNQEGQSTCTACGLNASCPLGSSSERNGSMMTRSQSIFDPYFSSKTKMGLVSWNSTVVQVVRVIFILAAIFAAFTALIVILFFQTLVHRKMIRSISYPLKFIDRFSRDHYVPVGENIKNKPKFNGGVATVVFFVICLALLAIVLAEIIGDNTTERSNIMANQLMPADVRDKKIIGAYSLDLTLLGYPAPDGCILGADVRLTETPDFVNASTQFRAAELYVTSRLHFDQTCQISVVCSGSCELPVGASRFSISLRGPWAMASALSYSFHAPHFQDGKLSQVSETIVPLDKSTVLSGTSPTTVELELTRTVRYDAPQDAFLGGLFSSVFNIQSWKQQSHVGYSVLPLTFELGSAMPADSAAAHKAYPLAQRSIDVTFILTQSHNDIQIVEEIKFTILDFVSKIAALFTAASALVGFILLNFEKTKHNIRQKRKQYNTRQELAEISKSKAAVSPGEPFAVSPASPGPDVELLEKPSEYALREMSLQLEILKNENTSLRHEIVGIWKHIQANSPRTQQPSTVDGDPL